MPIRPVGATALLTGVLVLAACGEGGQAEPEETAAGAPDAEATPDKQTSTPAPDDGTTAVDVARIPDGRYARTVTAADAEGVDLPPEQVEDFLGRDGELPMVLEFDGSNVKHYVTNDAGVEELGDLGTLDYPEDGQFVLTSESTGCPGCVYTHGWTLEGAQLTLAPPADDPEALFLFAGPWTLESN